MGFPGVTLSRPSEFQRASYLDSTTTGTRHSDSTRIAMRFAMLLDGVSFLFTSSFNSLCVGAALAWYVFHERQSLLQPTASSNLLVTQWVHVHAHTNSGLGSSTEPFKSFTSPSTNLSASSVSKSPLVRLSI